MNRVFCLVVSLALLPVCRMVTESDAVPKRETAERKRKTRKR